MAKRKRSKQKKRSLKRAKNITKSNIISSKRFSYLRESQDDRQFIELYEYKITDEPINIGNIPEEIHAEIEKIFQKISTKPASTIEPIKELIKKCPNVPQLYNYLSVAYSRIGEHKEAEKVAIDNYKANTNYLFAKLNYAEICIQKKEYDLIPDILEGKFEIKALYPDRNTFHVTEIVGFWGIAGLYFAGIGENDTAKLFYKNLKELVPKHPYTKRLKRHFLVSSLKSSFNKFIFPNKIK